jgi:DNA polymerase III subunit epsilon
LRELIFDTETTGLSPAHHRIVSFAAVETVNLEPTGRFLQFYLNPDRESDPRALEVHGLTSDFLRDKPRFGEVAASLLDFVNGDPLVIHNADFDVGFLHAELMRIGRSRYAGRVVCTKRMAQAQFGRGGSGTGVNYRPSNRLDDLVRRFGIRDLRTELGVHGALVDSLLLLNVYRGLRGMPVLDFPLYPYMDVVNGRASERSTESPGFYQAAAAAYLGGCPGAGGSGAEQELQRRSGVPDAGAPRGAEPAGTAQGTVAGGSALGEVA